MSTMQDLYQQIILDHAKDPHGRGLHEVPAGPGHLGHGESHQVNPTCGDEVTLRVTLGTTTPGGAPVIEDVSWEGQGCSISQASLSVLTDLVTGREVAEGERLGETFRALMSSRGEGLDEERSDQLEDAVAFAGVSRFPARIKCALLGWAALRDSLARAQAVAA